MGFINEVISSKVAEMLGDALDSAVKELDSSSNAETCIIKLLYALFI